MAYTIELSPRAFADIDAIVEHIQADSPQNATHWRRKLFEKIETLQTFPRGCSLAPEDERSPTYRSYSQVVEGDSYFTRRVYQFTAPIILTTVLIGQHSCRVSSHCDNMIHPITNDHVTQLQYSQFSTRMKPYSDFTQRFRSTSILF